MASTYAELMKVDIRRISIAIREIGPGGVWRTMDGEPAPVAVLMCDIREGRPPDRRADRAVLRARTQSNRKDRYAQGRLTLPGASGKDPLGCPPELKETDKKVDTEATSALLEAIRSLRSAFHVLVRDPQCLELALNQVVLDGAEGSYVISFTMPRCTWAMEWDSANSRWIERFDLSSPISGMITEAFVKQVPSGYVVSFSDGSAPLVRWGFAADAIYIRTASQS